LALVSPYSTTVSAGSILSGLCTLPAAPLDVHVARLLMQQASAVETICSNKSVEVLKLELSDVCQPVVVKVWAKKRTALSATQVGAP